MHYFKLVTVLFCFTGNVLDPHPAVPIADVRWLNDYIHGQGVPFEQAVHILKRKLFPFNYDPCSWVEGMSCYSDELKHYICHLVIYLCNC